MKFYVYYNKDSFKFELNPDLTVENVKNDLLDAILPQKIPQNGLDYLDFKLVNPLNGTELKESQYLGYYYGYTDSEPYSLEIIQNKHYHERRLSRFRSELAKSRSVDYSKKMNGSFEKILERNGDLEQKVRELEITLERERVNKLSYEKNKAEKQLEEAKDRSKNDRENFEKELASKDLQIQDLTIKLKEIEVNCLCSSSSKHEIDKPSTSSADLSNECKKLKQENDVKDTEIKELNSKLEEANSNILSMATTLKKQEQEILKLKSSLKEQLKIKDQQLADVQTEHEQLLIQFNSLKEKWRQEARKMFNKIIGVAQNSYKDMLAVEELGFLNDSEPSCSNEHPQRMAGNSRTQSATSLETSSSNYECVDSPNDGSNWSVHKAK